MKKKIPNLLILILILSIIGCSKQQEQKQYSTPVVLKQEYTKIFSPTFAIGAENITNLSINLYNETLADKTPEISDFKLLYKDFNNKYIPKNADEKDFQDYINKFENHYSLVSLNTSLIKGEQDLRDRGIESKDKYDKAMKDYESSKAEYLSKIKPDLDNIMKYYQ